MSGVMFANGLDSVSVSALGDVGVEIVVVTSDEVERYRQSSTYAPIDGVVTFGDLCELVNKCILLQEDMRTISLVGTPTPYATVEMTVVDGDSTVTASAKVFYCTAGNVGAPSSLHVFATQQRRRLIREDLTHYLLWLPLMASGTTFNVQTAVTYVKDGVQRTAHGVSTYTAASGSEGYQYINAAVPVLVKSVLGNALFHSCKVYYYEVAIWVDNVLLDCVEFEIDRRWFPQESVWYYRNCFGLVDQVLFRGHEQESHLFDGTFGYCGFTEVGLDRDVRKEYKTHSGWLTKGDFRLFGELYRSPVVGRLSGSDVKEVVVRGVEAQRTSPNNEPEGVVVTWRWADRREDWVADIGGNTVGHNTFDDTFEVTFD